MRARYGSGGPRVDPAGCRFIRIIQPVDVLPDGRQSMCDSCPDMTVHDGQLVWSCRLEERLKYGELMRLRPAAGRPKTEDAPT